MELRHLKYFVAVAEELHFRRAAERLHVAQPAVSEQIRKLEEELGVRLLDRTQRSVSLTDPGVALLREARRVLEQAEVARLAARSARDRATSSLRVGYMPASLPASVPRSLQRLAVAMPHLETTLEQGSDQDLIEAVRVERLDVAVVPLPAPTAGLRVTALGEQRAVAALPVLHDHAVKSEFRLEQVAPDRIVVLPRAANRPFYDAVIAACHDAGLSPTLVEIPDTHVERALLAVASGAGMALLPESIAERYGAPGVRFVTLVGDQPSFATAVVTRRDSAHMPTVAFLRAVSQADKPRTNVASGNPSSLPHKRRQSSQAAQSKAHRRAVWSSAPAAAGRPSGERRPLRLLRHIAVAGSCSTMPNRSGSASLSSRATKKYSAPAGSRVMSSRTGSPRTVIPCGTSFGSAAYEPASTSTRWSPTTAVIEPSRT